MPDTHFRLKAVIAVKKFLQLLDTDAEARNHVVTR